MVVVVKMDGLVSNITPGNIRRYFKDNGVRPEDIHITYPNHSRDGVAFLIFRERRDAEDGLKADGSLFSGRRLSVRLSSPQDFNRLFPGVPMLSKKIRPGPPPLPPSPAPNQNGQPKLCVVKVDGLDAKTGPGEVRKFLKERGSFVDEIHVMQGKDRNFHTTSAFLVFTARREADAALSADGCFFKSRKLMVHASSPSEFNKFFPGVPMLTRQSVPEVPKPNLVYKGVARVDGINLNHKKSDVRRFFRNLDARAADIHFIVGPNGKHEGSALIIFTERRDLEIALDGSGRFFEGHKMSVRPSNPKEFNRYFPSVDMISSSKALPQEGRPGRSEREPFPRHGNDTRVRDRSRSPIRAGRTERSEPTYGDSLAGIDQDKFIRMSGLPYDVGMTQIVNYFQPIQVRECYILKHADGKYNGQTTGSAIIEFFSKVTAKKALQDCDGRTMTQKLISLRYASKEDICRALNVPVPSDSVAPPFPTIPTDLSAAAGNPQLQNLLTLLTATVSAMASQPTNQPSRPMSRRPDRNNSVVTRVASSANVDVTDIKRGCVVGIRNLPYSVTPDEILKFFHGFHVIADSVRIHYLDNGRCSGDAIISFRGNRDARNAVSALNRKTIGHRKVELFFL